LTCKKQNVSSSTERRKMNQGLLDRDGKSSKSSDSESVPEPNAGSIFESNRAAQAERSVPRESVQESRFENHKKRWFRSFFDVVSFLLIWFHFFDVVSFWFRSFLMWFHFFDVVSFPLIWFSSFCSFSLFEVV